MNKRVFVGLGIIAAVVLAMFGITAIQSGAEKSKPSDDSSEINYADYERSVIKDMAAEIDLSSYDPYKIIAATPESGDLPEHIVGKADAPIKIVEFADYQCSHCAERNSAVEEILKKYGDKVALIFRPYVLSLTYDSKGVMAASAAEAAAIQGYWKEYKNLLFANQGEWYYSKPDEFRRQLEAYFVAASGGKGDLAKFAADMPTEAVAKRIAFSMALGNKVELTGTPSFYVNGEFVKPSELESKVKSLVKKLED